MRAQGYLNYKEKKKPVLQSKNKASEMAQLVSVLTMQAWWPEFNPPNP